MFFLMIASYDWIQHNWIELIAVITGILGVWLTTKQIIWCWPIALISVVLYIYIFFNVKLYADFGLQIFYFVMTLYGWYNWLYGGKNHDHLVVSRLKKAHAIIYFIIGFVAMLSIGYLLKRYTDAALPYWDSVVSVWGIIGTLMMAKKILENWIIWIVVDLLCIGIYSYKLLFATAILYLIYTILAIIGLIEWKKSYQATA